MRVLITGAAGFLGSHLCDRFLADGHSVIGMDNLITGTPDNLRHLEGRPDLRLVRHDVTTYIDVPEELDGVLHFASPASPADYLDLPIQTLKVGSLGTHNALGLAKAKGSRLLLASTSEVYGDPEVHPQPESYWGHVNPIGPRGVYDEAKRFAEAITVAYHRVHGVDTRIARIFNSVLADEMVVLFNDEVAHIEPIGEYAARVEASRLEIPMRVYVPAFDPRTLGVELRLASVLIRHPSYDKDAFRIATRYGRQIRVTGDHSVFRRSAGDRPEAVPVRELCVGDYIAIPARLPVVERDVSEIDVAERLMRSGASEERLWDWALESPALADAVEDHQDAIFDGLLESSRFDGSRSKRNTAGCALRKYRERRMLPLSVLAPLVRRGLVRCPQDALVRPHTTGRGTPIPNRISITDDLLWLAGLFLAEGCHVRSGGTYRLLVSSDRRFVERAARIFQRCFGVQPRVLGPHPGGRAPSLYVDSKALVYVFEKILGLTGKSDQVRIPPWIFQLPLSRVKHFLEGYRQGDGTHTRYPENRELSFNTVSEGLATDLTYLLLRFGLVASVGRYETTFRERYGERRFPFWRVTICEVSNFDILTWDGGVEQTLNARRTGDLVWARIREIEPIEASRFVYDFSVDGYENFVAGNGVFAHNTFGPRMRPNDGRVVSNFIVQALRREPLTVYGDGSQTRSFCYVSDLVEGIYRLFHEGDADPVNLGNPREFTIRELADEVLAATGSTAGIRHLPLPTDDPKVRQPDISRARTLLGWEPTVPLREGLERTIAYFRALQAKDGLEKPPVITVDGG